jgi:signal transduction histidine kinase
MPGHDAESPDIVGGLVFDERVRALYAKGRVALLTNLVNAGVAVAGLWNLVPRERALLWLAAMTVLIAVRALGWHRHQLAIHRADAGGIYDAAYWERFWTVGAAFAGAAWGTAGVLLFPDSLGGQNLLLFLIGGMVAGASASMSSYLPSFSAFTVLALTPPMARLFLENDRAHWAMAFLLIIFGVAMTAVARSGGQALDTSIRLRFENELLNKDLEARVAQRTEALEKALADRDNFISVVSHELRTPLHSMKLNQGIIRQLFESPEADPRKVRRGFDVISRQLTRMQRLVDDLLDMRRLSTDRMSYRMADVSLLEVVDGALEQMAPQLDVLGVRFSKDCQAGLLLSGDRHRLEQVLINLMSNAIKYGEAPFAIALRSVADRVQISVSDSGKGIPSADLECIFEAFERLDSSGSGLGLGLFIAQRIVRAHGGRIFAESAPGQGTRFVVELSASPLVHSEPMGQHVV